MPATPQPQGGTPPPSAVTETVIFNNDLLLDARDRALAQRKWPGVFHVLDDPELRVAFEAIDVPTTSAKRQSRGAGALAVVLAVLGLMGVAAGTAIGHGEHGFDWARTLGIVSGVVSFGSVFIALAVVNSPSRKTRWLEGRLRAERLRQLHFQSFIWRLAEIAAAADAKGREKFDEQRRLWRQDLERRHERKGNSPLAHILDADGGEGPWLHPAPGPPHIPEHFEPSELFEAYRELRLEHQLQYANRKLQMGPLYLNFLRLSARRQVALLHALWAVSFALLLVLHLAIAIGLCLETPYQDLARNHWAHVGIIALALIALGSRTLQEGLTLRRDIERYEEHRAVIKDLLARFKMAPDNHARLEVMIEMERSNFEELRAFIRTQHEATFVL